MTSSRFVQVSKPNGPFEIVERDIPEPEDKQVVLIERGMQELLFLPTAY
jgi:hypothetical protein